MDRLGGKIAIVTGGSSGAGAAICRLFLAEGAAVLVADAAPVADEELLGVMGRHPDRVEFWQLDPNDEASVVAACAAVRTRWGNVDVAVAGACGDSWGPVTGASQTDWDAAMAAGARGAFLLVKHVVPQMLEKGGGSIIALSSVLAMAGAVGKAAQSAGAGAARAFVKAIACEWVREDIRVNSVHLGMLGAASGGLGSGTAEDIGWACVFLASDEARFISGAELVIDGGALAG